MPTPSSSHADQLPVYGKYKLRQRLLNKQTSDLLSQVYPSVLTQPPNDQRCLTSSLELLTSWRKFSEIYADTTLDTQALDRTDVAVKEAINHLLGRQIELPMLQVRKKHKFN